MGHLEHHERRSPGSRSEPDSDRGPTLVAAFEGWSDAGEAATSTVEHLWGQWSATTIASIDPEEFYDFTATRPRARIDRSGSRVLDWPENELGLARTVGAGGVVLLRGVEPQLRWRTFCEQILEVVEDLGCRWLVTVGALLADVPHTRPTPVFGTSDDDRLRERFDLGRSDYEGPTGILGALHDACGARGIPTASLWAAVPSYAPTSASPKAAAALASRTAALIGAPVDTGVLDVGALSYERQLDELVSDDEATAEYVRLLERQHDTERHDGAQHGAVDADRLLDEVERFLRDQ